MRCLLIVVCAAAVLSAGDTESLHIFNGNLDFSRRATLQLHGRVRMNHNVSDFYQVRGGALLLLQQNPRLQWISGYYLVEQEGSARRLFDVHRVFGGGQIRLWQAERKALDWRNLLERHFTTSAPDFWRYRTRMMVAGKSGAGWQPYASAEGLVTRGIWTTRLAGGMQYLGTGGRMIGFGYEWRQYLTGPASHIITTSVQFPVWRRRGLEPPPRASTDQGSSKTASTGK